MHRLLRPASHVAHASARSWPCSFNRTTLFLSGKDQSRTFRTTTALAAIKPFLLADVGEGITQCEIVTWMVKPGDEIDEFDPVCEVQSDKAAVEITSRFKGKVTKLHHEVGDLANVGKPLLDIDVGGVVDVSPAPSQDLGEAHTEQPEQNTAHGAALASEVPIEEGADVFDQLQKAPVPPQRSWVTTLASPVVRRMLHEENIDITEIEGTGKDGRVVKEDVQNFIKNRGNGHAAKAQMQQDTNSPRALARGLPYSEQRPLEDRRVKLSPIQSQMAQAMTRSLSIPHFLYTHKVDVSSFMGAKKQFMKHPSATRLLEADGGQAPKLSLLPLTMKAISMALRKYPLVNSRVHSADDVSTLEVEMVGAHNFGIAVDTPSGLLVPVVRNVQNQSVASLAKEISRLASLAKEKKLRPEDMQGGSLVVSNIGSIGGQVVAPVILAPMAAIVAIGAVEDVAVVEEDDKGVVNVAKTSKVTLSWSADHRILDGATVAECAREASVWLENPAFLGIGSH